MNNLGSYELRPLDAMSDFDSLFQGFRFYKQLRVMDNMYYSRSSAQGSRYYA